MKEESSTYSGVSTTYGMEEDQTSRSITRELDLFEIENTLRACNIIIDKDACQVAASLLKILKRKLKVDVVVITQYNVNTVLFRLKDRRTSSKAILISSDVDHDHQIDTTVRQKFRGNVKSVISAKIEYDYGQYGSLIALSSRPRETVTVEDLAFIADITGCIETLVNYQQKQSTWTTSRSNLSLCSGLLGCLKPTLSDLTSIFDAIRDSWEEMNNITAMTPLHSRTMKAVLEQYKRRLINKMERIELLLVDFMQTQTMVCQSVERILAVAKGYFLKDAETYIKTCSDLVGVGLVENINQILKKLSQKLPSNSILWCFKVDSILAHAAHRSFYHHLTLFLENIIYYWSRYCSTTQMFISFEPVERNELPTRVPNVLPRHRLPTKINADGEDENDYTHVIEGYIKVLLQFPDKITKRNRAIFRQQKVDYGDDNASYASSHVSNQSKLSAVRPPGLTIAVGGGAGDGGSIRKPSLAIPPSPTTPSRKQPKIYDSSLQTPNKTPQRSASAPRSPRSIGSQSHASTSKSRSRIARFFFPDPTPSRLIPDEEGAHHQQKQINNDDEEEVEEEEDEEDDFDPDHPVHHISPLLSLLNSSLLRLNETSTAKSVNIMSESTKHQTEEAYFIRIPCLLYLTETMDTAFLQYHGYKYNDFRFQKRKRRNSASGKPGVAPVAVAPAGGGGGGVGKNHQSSKKLRRKNSKHRIGDHHHAHKSKGNTTVTNYENPLSRLFVRFICFLTPSGSKRSSRSPRNNSAGKSAKNRPPTSRWVAVQPDPMHAIENPSPEVKVEPIVLSSSNSSADPLPRRA